MRRMTKHLALIAIIGFGLTACEPRDKGAEMAACNLDEMRSDYPDKARAWREFTADVNAGRDHKTTYEMIVRHRMDFLRFCMRAKGWDVKPETSCLQQHADQTNCYIRATDET